MISVIIPVYMAEEHLAACLDSLLAQSYTDFEIIAVNDGSPDASGEILASYAQKDARIRSITKENGGVSSARNSGLSHAKGDYCIFVDSDDFVEPDYLFHLQRCAQKTKADMVICNIDSYYESFDVYMPIGDSEVRHGIPDVFYFEDFSHPATSLLTPNVVRLLLRRSFVEKAGLSFDEKLKTSEDLLFIYQLLCHNPRISCVDKTLYHYRKEHEESLSHGDKRTDCLSALGKLHHYMHEMHGEDEFYRKHWVNIACDAVQYGLYASTNPTEYKNLYQSFKAALYHDICADERLVDPAYRNFLERVSQNSDTYLFEMFWDHRRALDDASAELQALYKARGLHGVSVALRKVRRLARRHRRG